MSEQVDKLTSEVSELDTNEQNEENEITALRAQVTELKKELEFAQDNGDKFAIQAATDKLHVVNTRLSVLLAMDESVSATPVTTSAETTLQVNIPPKE